MSNLTMPLLSVATHATAGAKSAKDIHGKRTVDSELRCRLGSPARTELTADPPEDGSATIFKAETLRAHRAANKPLVQGVQNVQVVQNDSGYLNALNGWSLWNDWNPRNNAQSQR